MALARGSRLGPYEILSPLGAGGMGEVYRATDTRLGREVAIKVLPPEFATDPERLKRFEREARATAALDHPNLLAVHDVGTHEGTPYIVEQLLEGESLRSRLTTGDLPLRETLEIGAQIARGLAAAHARNILHRDLKPENVFLTKEGTVKLLDFGLAKLLSPVDTEGVTVTAAPESTTVAGRVLGTVAYMAPEQARGLPLDQRADIFAFGVVLYELLAGERPFRGQTHSDVLAAILKEDPPPLPKRLPPGLDSLVFRCLEKRPEDRFSSAHDLALALETLARTSAPGRVSGVTATSRLKAAPPQVRIVRIPQRRTVIVGAALSIAVLTLAGFWSIRRWRQVTWARKDALPNLVRLVDARDYWPAFLLARRIEAIVPDDPTLTKLRVRFIGSLKRELRPAGAKVLARPPKGGESDWVQLGIASGKPLPAPLGHSVFKVQASGLEPREFAMTVSEFNFAEINSLGGVFELARKGEVPDGMVRVDNPAKESWLGLDPWIFDFAPPQMAPYFVDKYEVTNQEYKRFVDAGGYQKREYWNAPFVRNGKALGWDEAMALFRDSTGRPGPATWEIGTFKTGHGDLPVTGVSWWEAAAYAEFAGKRLPSIYQWALASAPTLGGDFVPASNFSGNLAPVGSYHGSLNIWGLYDVAGNAREWCTNPSGDERFALGGAADGPAYMFWSPPVTKPPFDRNPTTGFRCIKSAEPDPRQAQLDLPVARKAIVDRSKDRGFSDDAWKSWQGLLSYSRGSLGARTEWTDDTLPTWRMEKVSFAAAYGNERVVAYLFLPKTTPPPWQAVIFFPGGYAPFVSSSEDGRNTLDLSYWDYLVKDGRAVVYPILKGTFERGGGPDMALDPSMANCIPPVKDVFRTIDYLETRTDIRKDLIGYLGFSWGAVAGPMICSVESRIKTAVFLGAGGFDDPELLGFARHCSMPIQMVNGRFDGFGESHSPLFRALGTAADRKRHVVFDADHSLAGVEKDVIKVNLEWFDRYLGSVRGAAK